MGLGTGESTGTSAIYYHIFDNIECTTIIVATALLPGYLAAFLVIDSWGRRPLQLMGFIVLSILFLIMGSYHPLFCCYETD
jgi:PHS family inorganic phosphate transporter-like MFS transporter